MAKEVTPMTLSTKKTSLLVAALIVMVTQIAFGQGGTSGPVVQRDIPASPEFEVASIRVNVSIGGRQHIISSSHDSHFRTINVTLLNLLQYAFDIPQTRIMDAPSWLNAEKFDIEAKADGLDDQLAKMPSDESKLEKRKMLQALLADRFQLKSHQETRQLPVYAMIIAKNGSRLQASKANGCMINSGRSHISIEGCASVAVLAEALAENLGRVVVDKTGLDGRYDIDLKWTADDSTTQGADSVNGLTIDPGPSLFTALQEQLGLKLESEKGPVQVLVVDHVEQPSAN